MDSDPRALSDMFTTPAIQTPIAAQSYLMDNDSTTNGRSKGIYPLAQLVTYSRLPTKE